MSIFLKQGNVILRDGNAATQGQCCCGFNIKISDVSLSGDVSYTDCVAFGGTVSFSGSHSGLYSTIPVDPTSGCGPGPFGSCQFGFGNIQFDLSGCSNLDGPGSDPDSGSGGASATVYISNTGVSHISVAANSDLKSGLTTLCGSFVPQDPPTDACGYVTCFIVGSTSSSFDGSWASWSGWNTAVAHGAYSVSINEFSQNQGSIECGNVNCCGPNPRPPGCVYACYNDYSGETFYSANFNLSFTLEVVKA